MKTKSSSDATRSADRLGRRIPRPAKHLDVDRLHAGEAWLLQQLVCGRYHLSIETFAHDCGVGEQTMRDYLRGRHPEAWGTNARIVEGLGYFTDEWEHLTRRWMRKYRHREKRAHANEPHWTLRYPWE